jgi:hypothetical protein
MQTGKRYFSIHSIEALNNKQFSVIRANITNTNANYIYALDLYPDSLYLIEFHDIKINLNVTI